MKNTLNGKTDHIFQVAPHPAMNVIKVVMTKSMIQNFSLAVEYIVILLLIIINNSY